METRTDDHFTPIYRPYKPVPRIEDFFAAALAVREFGSVTLRAALYSPVFAPRPPNAERLCRHMTAARGRENHAQSYMLRGEQAPIMRV